MKFRRGRSPSGGSLELDDGSGWRALTASDLDSHGAVVAMLEACPPLASNEGSGFALPFQPRSYRDFMLYERHFVQAGRGYLKRFRPSIFRLARAYEALTRRTFPPLQPPDLWRREPIYYMGNHLQFVSDGAEVVWPDYTEALDYELELGFVLATPIRNATPEEALAAIGGFVVFNDFSARDVQVPEMRSGFGPQKSKHFCNSISATLISAGEILPRVNSLTGRVIINDVVVSECSSQGMQFTLGEALAHASKAEALQPGEFFGSGTWPGGAGMETSNWLRRGDRIRVEIDGLGAVTNRIVAE